MAYMEESDAKGGSRQDDKSQPSSGTAKNAEPSHSPAKNDGDIAQSDRKKEFDQCSEEDEKDVLDTEGTYQTMNLEELPENLYANFSQGFRM